MSDLAPPRPSVRFGDFELIPHLRRLERGGVAVALSSRAIDILAILTERPGEIVSKRELLERVWPDTSVEEGSLRFHMVTLRRALGDSDGAARYIATVPGRGYCFVGADLGMEDAATAGQAIRHAAPLPVNPSEIVGRADVAEELGERLQTQRFVTVVGPGGIGKTTVALMAAHQWAAAHEDLVVFVDLGDLWHDSEEAVADAVATALALASQGAARDRVIDHLRTQEALIVLDTCERVVEGAARFAEALFVAAPGVRLLATSREALRVEGEVVYRIQPLAAPPADAGLSAAEALTYPAVQLFVQRAAANHAGFDLRDEDAPLASAICRDLDGMALAIELAAGRVEAFGVRQLADLLSTEFALTWPGRRTAVPRQQTLNATLKWSYELLGPIEQRVLRRLSALAGGFSLKAAIVVCDQGDTAPDEIMEAMFSLAAKSLLTSAPLFGHPRYRMLDTTRAYAAAKLAASGEEGAVRRSQARFYLARLQEETPQEARRIYTPAQTGNIGSVLGWAFGADGDTSLGIWLAAAATPLWLRQGLLVDCRKWAGEALARLDAGDGGDTPIDARVVLSSARARTGSLSPEAYDAWKVVYERDLCGGHREHQLLGLVVLWAQQARLGNFDAAQQILDEADFLQSDANPAHRAMAQWMLGTSANLLGRYDASRRHAEALLSGNIEAAGELMLRRFGYDIEVAGWLVLVISHFFSGDFDSALSACARAVAKAHTLRNPFPLSDALRWRTFLAYFLDEGDEVERLTASLAEPWQDKTMDLTVGCALAFRGLWFARKGNLAHGAELARRGLNICEEVGYFVFRDLVRAELALQIVRHGAATDLGLPPYALEDATEENWCGPEILRIKGEIAERRGDPEQAEDLRRRALAMAERQGALTWSLRVANDQSALWLAQGRPDQAEQLLAPLYARFEPGLESPDLRRAAACLEACRRARAADGDPTASGDDPSQLTG